MIEVSPPLPGRVLRGTLQRMHMKQADLARAMGISQVRMSQILNGHAPITAETALRLGKVTGTEPEYWLRLQSEFDLHQANRRLRPVLDTLPVLQEAEAEEALHTP